MRSFAKGVPHCLSIWQVTLAILNVFQIDYLQSLMLDLHPEISANRLNNIECMHLTLSTETDRRRQSLLWGIEFSKSIAINSGGLSFNLGVITITTPPITCSRAIVLSLWFSPFDFITTRKWPQFKKLQMGLPNACILKLFYALQVNQYNLSIWLFKNKMNTNATIQFTAKTEFLFTNFDCTRLIMLT